VISENLMNLVNTGDPDIEIGGSDLLNLTEDEMRSVSNLIISMPIEQSVVVYCCIGGLVYSPYFDGTPPSLTTEQIEINNRILFFIRADKVRLIENFDAIPDIWKIKMSETFVPRPSKNSPLEHEYGN
jgi:hypothetical protein